MPKDKLILKNIIRYDEYLWDILFVDNRRLVFLDEKSLKGREIYNRKGRANPLSDEPIMQYVTGNFRSVYCIMGIILVQHEKVHQWFTILVSLLLYSNIYISNT